MNFYDTVKETLSINEEKSFVSGGIAAMAKAVNDGRTIGFLTARAGMENHNKLIRQMMIMTALKMSNRAEDFKSNFFKVKKQFDRKLFFFINDMDDTIKKIKSQIDGKVFFETDDVNKENKPFLLSFKDMDMKSYLSKMKNDEKKAYILKLLDKVYGGKIKFFDDEEKNIVTAKKLEGPNSKIKTYDIKDFKEYKLVTKRTNDNSIFMFDIDGTIIDAEATVWILKNDGSRHGISQEDFATGRFKLEMGDKLDFKEFSDREHLKKLGEHFNNIVRLKMIDKFYNLNIPIKDGKLNDDEFVTTFNGKKLILRRMPNDEYLITYDGTKSKAKNLQMLLKNLKKYFKGEIVKESITEFSEARILKLGLKRINKNENDIYRYKNYFAYLNHFDEDNTFVFVKEKNLDDKFFLLNEKHMSYDKLNSLSSVFNYLENNKENVVSWNSLAEMIKWLRDNRQLPLNESYFKDIMILEE